MTEEEKTVATEETPTAASPAETPAEPSTGETSGNFGEEASNNFGEEAEAASATGFEDNFGLGDQQLSAGTIPSPPSPPKKKEVPPVTPRVREGESLSGVEPGPAAATAAGSEQPSERKRTREEELFERFQLMRVPEKFCQYTAWFRGYLIQHPDAG